MFIWSSHLHSDLHADPFCSIFMIQICVCMWESVSDVLRAFEIPHTFVLDCFAVMAFGGKNIYSDSEKKKILFP